MNIHMMKRTFMLAALPAAILATNAQAADVYGKINVSLQNNHADTKNPLFNGGVSQDALDNWSLDSNASRFGIKGDADLGDNWKGVYKIEYEVAVDDGDSSTTYGPKTTDGNELKQRNIYGGLQAGWGTLIAGKFDSPMKESQGKIDEFNDYTVGDIKGVLSVGEDRLPNLIMYSIPKNDMNITLNIAVAPGEQAGQKATTGAGGVVTDKYNGPMDQKSVSVAYDTEALYVALAHNINTSSQASLPNQPANTATSQVGADITRLSAQVKVMDSLRVGAIYQTADAHDELNGKGYITQIKGPAIGTAVAGGAAPAIAFNTFNVKKQDGYVLSAAWTMDKHVIKAEYGSSTAKSITAPAVAGTYSHLDMTQWDVGYDYKIGSKTTLYAYYGAWKAEFKLNNNKNETSADTFGVGFEQKF